VDFITYYDQDQKLSEIFRVQGVPLNVALDRNNSILYYQAGERDWFNKSSIELAQQWLAQSQSIEPIPQKEY